jgi:hypothetical protein
MMDRPARSLNPPAEWSMKEYGSALGPVRE